MTGKKGDGQRPKRARKQTLGRQRSGAVVTIGGQDYLVLGASRARPGEVKVRCVAGGAVTYFAEATQL